MPSQHALLSPSSAERWLSCPPSARLEEQFPEETSVYAEEGTKAHALCEMRLRHLMAGDPIKPVFDHPSKMYMIKNSDLDEVLSYPKDMWEFTSDYVEYVNNIWVEAKKKDKSSVLQVEVRLDLSKWVPECFGTSDAVVLTDGRMHVIDFKYGMGVPVDAHENPQLRLYALGAYEKFRVLYEITEVEYHVFQPRIGNESSEVVSTGELIRWAEAYVKPRAELAFNGEGEYCIGDHCRFCKAGGVCRARAEAAFAVVEREHDLPPVLDDDEIPAILDKLDETEKWIASVKKYALSKAIEGRKWEGYKLVESRTNRKITDEIKAADRLKEKGYSLEEFTNTKLKGITDLEKLVGKKNFSGLLGDLVVKPVGEPTLVKESDKRPEITPAALAFKEEIDETSSN